MYKLSFLVIASSLFASFILISTNDDFDFTPLAGSDDGVEPETNDAVEPETNAILESVTLYPSEETVINGASRDDAVTATDGNGAVVTDSEAARQDDVALKKMKILIFGGNGMLGADTTEKLLKLPNGADIFLVHRGNWRWNTASTIEPFVTGVFICDRTRHLRDCASFNKFILDSTTYFDFVIDFSAYNPAVIEDALELLKRTYVGLYIFISSDSVYEVCVKEDVSVWSREEDARRPTDPREIKRLNALDSYGDGKLACEESLLRSGAAGGPPSISLRLPDVIGSRDNTDRFWMTHILLNLHTFLTKPLKIPRDDYLMSFVYSEDVASLIHSIVTSADPLAFADEAFNVAWPQPVSFHRFYSTIVSSLPIGKPFNLEPADEDGEQDSQKLHFFPSVTRGPVNVTKLTTAIGWAPTDWTKAIVRIVGFYKEAATKYPENFKRALRGLNGKLDEETLKKASFGVYAVELSSGGCIDLHPKCALWAVTGECDRNPRWMKPNCMESCHTCHLLNEARQKDRPKDEL